MIQRNTGEDLFLDLIHELVEAEETFRVLTGLVEDSAKPPKSMEKALNSAPEKEEIGGFKVAVEYVPDQHHHDDEVAYAGYPVTQTVVLEGADFLFTKTKAFNPVIEFFEILRGLDCLVSADDLGDPLYVFDEQCPLSFFKVVATLSKSFSLVEVVDSKFEEDN